MTFCAYQKYHCSWCGEFVLNAATHHCLKSLSSPTSPEDWLKKITTLYPSKTITITTPERPLYDWEMY